MKAEQNVGNFIANAARFAIGSKKGHADLVDDALQAFTAAEAKMEGAINQINEEISAEAKIAREAQERMESAKGSKDKLTRVLDRLKALTA